MTTIEVQVTNQKAIKLLKDLEDLQLLKIVRRKKKPPAKLSEKFSGILPDSVAEEMQKYIVQSRNE